jgi:hypothetical protein
MEVVDQVKGVALKAKSDVEKVALQAKLFVVQQWNNRLVQVSVFAGIVFWILSSVPLMDEVEKFLSKTFKFKFGKEGVRLVHAVVRTGPMKVAAQESARLHEAGQVICRRDGPVPAVVTVDLEEQAGLEEIGWTCV